MFEPETAGMTDKQVKNLLQICSEILDQKTSKFFIAIYLGIQKDWCKIKIVNLLGLDKLFQDIQVDMHLQELNTISNCLISVYGSPYSLV